MSSTPARPQRSRQKKKVRIKATVAMRDYAKAGQIHIVVPGLGQPPKR